MSLQYKFALVNNRCRNSLQVNTVIFKGTSFLQKRAAGTGSMEGSLAVRMRYVPPTMYLAIGFGVHLQASLISTCNITDNNKFLHSTNITSSTPTVSSATSKPHHIRGGPVKVLVWQVPYQTYPIFYFIFLVQNTCIAKKNQNNAMHLME